jgi:hypothetical protein
MHAEYKKYYLEHEAKRGIQGQNEEKYFKCRPEIAELTHGILLILEIASVMKLLLMRGLEFDITLKGLVRELFLFFEGSENIIEILEGLSKFEVGEVVILSKIVNKNMQIPLDNVNMERRLNLLSKRNIHLKYALLISLLSLTIALISLLYK